MYLYADTILDNLKLGKVLSLETLLMLGCLDVRGSVYIR